MATMPLTFILILILALIGVLFLVTYLQTGTLDVRELVGRIIGWPPYGSGQRPQRTTT